MLVEKTGRNDVPSRVIRVKMSEQLSEWLGVSDKNFDGLFNDIQEMACEGSRRPTARWCGCRWW